MTEFIFYEDLWFIAIATAALCEIMRWMSKKRLKGSNVMPHWIHDGEKPRFGGVCILITMAVTLAVFWGNFLASQVAPIYTFLVVSAFAVGFIEDIVGNISARTRLLLTSLIVVLTCSVAFLSNDTQWLLNNVVNAPPLLFILFVAIGVGTLHGTNLIDGLNGLAAFWGLGALLILFQLASNQPSFSAEEQAAILNIIAICFLCLSGFLLINFPLGRVFLGDAGAYLIGLLVFLVATLVATNTSDYRPLFQVAAILSYPLMEIGWTVVRRLFVLRVGVFTPDKRHLHSSVFLVIQGRFSSLSATAANSLATVIIMTSVVQVTFWTAVFMPNDILAASLTMLVIPCTYLAVYFLAHVFLSSTVRHLE